MMTDLKGSVSALKESIDNVKEQSRDRDRRWDEAAKEHDRKFETIAKEVRDVGLEVNSAKAAGKTCYG